MKGATKMKKIALVFISLLVLSSFAYAEYIVEEKEVVIIDEELIPNNNEVSFFYSSKRDAKGVNSQRYWHLKTARLGWKSDYYNVDLAVSPLTGSQPMIIKEAYAKLQPFGFIDMYLGKKCYAFNSVSSRAANNITIYQPQLFGSAWQLQFSKECIKNFFVNLFWADGGTASDWNSYDRPSVVGGMVKYANDDMEIGASMMAENWYDVDDFVWDDTDMNNYGVYLKWNMLDMFDLNLHAYRYIETSVNNDNIGYFGILSYSKGMNLPIFHKTVPYVGYFSKRDENGDEGKEYNMVAGLHTSPLENAFIKMEYNHDSMEIKNPQTFNEEMSDAFTVSVGYEF